MPTMSVKVTTDESGFCSHMQTVDAGLPLNLPVKIKARLLSPSDTTVKGTLDIDAADGKPSNDAKEFTLSATQTSLGTWKLDKGKNILNVTGQTDPVRPNIEIEIEIETSL